MKSTGIVRKLDQLGRVVIPIELRRTLGVDVKDSLEIFTEGEMIILKKYEPRCVICGEGKTFVKYKDRMICTECVEEIKG